MVRVTHLVVKGVAVFKGISVAQLSNLAFDVRNFLLYNSLIVAGPFVADAGISFGSVFK